MNSYVSSDWKGKPVTHNVAWTAALAALILLPPGRPAPVAPRPTLAQGVPDVMTRSIAAYSALNSYSDSGTVEIASPGMVDRAKFTTRFRRQNGDLYLDYQAIGTYYPETKSTVDMNM